MIARPTRALLTAHRQRVGRVVRASAVGASVIALSASGIGAAGAQSAATGSLGSAGSSGSAEPGSAMIVPSFSVAALTQLGAPIPLTAVLGSLDAMGSSNFARPSSSAPSTDPIARRDESITDSHVVNVEPLFPASLNPVDKRAEVWTVTSEEMQREVRVEVYRAPAGVDAPNVYFLDGVGSESPSGWSGGMGWGDGAIRAMEANVIAPTGAPASMWSDWNNDDPVLGPNEWETFLTEELPPLLEEGHNDGAPKLAHNDDWGVLGVSMGASAALHLANTYDMFNATGGISGAYSTLDDLGYQYARLTVGARNGDVTNMWGERGSAEWKKHDTVGDPSGLQGKTVYVSAATGVVGSVELGQFGQDPQLLIDGHLLEKGAYESTKQLEYALESVDNVDLRTSYEASGIHNWPVFVPQMRPAMSHILSGLKAATPNLDTMRAAGGVEADALGSLGSAGSSGSSGSAGSAGAGSSGSKVN